MCDYSLEHLASRPAKVGDKLVTTRFGYGLTGGFCAVGDPHVAVCVQPGTELAFEREIESQATFRLFSPASTEPRWGGFGASMKGARQSITMRSNCRADRSFCLAPCAKASARTCCSCRRLSASTKRYMRRPRSLRSEVGAGAEFGGETQADIARTYGVDATTIGRLDCSPA